MLHSFAQGNHSPRGITLLNKLLVLTTWLSYQQPPIGCLFVWAHNCFKSFPLVQQGFGVFRRFNAVPYIHLFPPSPPEYAHPQPQGSMIYIYAPILFYLHPATTLLQPLGALYIHIQLPTLRLWLTNDHSLAASYPPATRTL